MHTLAHHTIINYIYILPCLTPPRWHPCRLLCLLGWTFRFTMDDSGLVPSSPPQSDYFMPDIEILRNDVTHALDSLWSWWSPPYCSQEPSLVILFRLCLSTSTYPFCWKNAYIQPVLKKSDCYNPSNYRPITLIICFSKVFESLLNRKIQGHLSAHNLQSDRQKTCYCLMPQKLNSFIHPFDKTFPTTITSTSMTHTCPSLLHWTSLGNPLLKLLTGSFISLLLVNQLPRTAFLHLLLSSTVIFMLTALLNLLTACLPRSCGLTAHDFLLIQPYFVHLPYARVNHYLHSLVPSTGKFWNSLPESVFPSSYDLNSFKRGVSRHLLP